MGGTLECGEAGPKIEIKIQNLPLSVCKLLRSGCCFTTDTLNGNTQIAWGEKNYTQPTSSESDHTESKKQKQNKTSKHKSNIEIKKTKNRERWKQKGTERHPGSECKAEGLLTIQSEVLEIMNMFNLSLWACNNKLILNQCDRVRQSWWYWNLFLAWAPFHHMSDIKKKKNNQTACLWALTQSTKAVMLCHRFCTCALKSAAQFLITLYVHRSHTTLKSKCVWSPPYFGIRAGLCDEAGQLVNGATSWGV